MLPGSATAQATARFAERFPAAKAAGFYRVAQFLTVSNIGIGTYLGEMDEAIDRGYREAVTASLAGGVNFIDTSLNYRNQRSERAIGIALKEAIGGGLVRRDEIVVCTKAGYLVPDAIPQAGLSASDIVGRMHCLAPVFLSDQLSRSRENLGLETVDAFYLHNPETQLSHVSQDEFYNRIRAAFSFLETAAGQGRIRFYGAATWNGFRVAPQSKEALSIERLAGIANDLAGADHHFRFIQLPMNLAMPEAFANQVDGNSVLAVAARSGITAIASASLLQARLAAGLPREIRDQMPGAQTDAQCAIQFARSTPGITTALVGMSGAKHVHENLALANVSPAGKEQYLGLYRH